MNKKPVLKNTAKVILRIDSVRINTTIGKLKNNAIGFDYNLNAAIQSALSFYDQSNLKHGKIIDGIAGGFGYDSTIQIDLDHWNF